MDDGIIQVTESNIDDILDSTYEILLIFCEKVNSVVFLLMNRIIPNAKDIDLMQSVLLSYWQVWKSRFTLVKLTLLRMEDSSNAIMLLNIPSSFTPIRSDVILRS